MFDIMGMGLYWPEETLREHRETSSFSDQHIRDLTDLYAHEKHSVARKLLVQPLIEGLEAQVIKEGVIWLLRYSLKPITFCWINIWD